MKELTIYAIIILPLITFLFLQRDHEDSMEQFLLTLDNEPIHYLQESDEEWDLLYEDVLTPIEKDSISSPYEIELEIEITTNLVEYEIRAKSERVGERSSF